MFQLFHKIIFSLNWFYIVWFSFQFLDWSATVCWDISKLVFNTHLLIFEILMMWLQLLREILTLCLPIYNWAATETVGCVEVTSTLLIRLRFTVLPPGGGVMLMNNQSERRKWKLEKQLESLQALAFKKKRVHFRCYNIHKCYAVFFKLPENY